MKMKHQLGGSEVYECSKCGVILDRDINGARTILIKNLFISPVELAAG